MAGTVDSQSFVMWSMGQIAERDKVSKQAVSKTVQRLVQDHGIPVERDSRGRIAKVSLAHYDHHRGFFGNSAKTPTRPEEPDEGTGNNSSRDEALRLQAWLDLQRKRVAHQEDAKQLLRADRYRDALALAGRTIQSEINRLPNKADDLAMAVGKNGPHGARMALRQIAAEINTRIADALASIAAEAPAEDEPMAEAAE